MLFANNQDGARVYIDDAKYGHDYYCPLCEEKLICKFGDIRSHHFAHKGHSGCSDSWHYDMSEWHSVWQSYFPEDNQEVVFSNNGIKHRADVAVGNTVIEFQHSRISPDEFYERNNFYHKLGKKIIWVFDAADKFDWDMIYGPNIEEVAVRCLKTSSPIFTERFYRKSADLILLCEETEDNDADYYLLQASWFWIGNNSRSSKVVVGIEKIYSNDEFVDLILGKGKQDNSIEGPIPYLWRKNHIKNEAIFMNYKGFKVRIVGDPIRTYEKYGRLYGYFAAPGSSHFNFQSKQVYGMMDDWKLIFKK